MADETINLNTAGDVVTETPAAVAPAKKTRAPRGSKKTAQPVSLMPTAATEKPAKKTRAKKIAAATTEAPAAEVKERATRQPRAKAAAPGTAVSTPALDDISDLLTLEEENKQLRKQLSEKLRAENADLRKRLGQN